MTDEIGIEDEDCPIQGMTADVLNLLSELDNANEAMQVLVASITYILCNNVKTEKEARAVSSKIYFVIGETMNAAKLRGETIWNDGAWH